MPLRLDKIKCFSTQRKNVEVQILTIQRERKRHFVKDSKPKQSMLPSTICELTDTPMIVEGVVNLLTK